MHSRIRQSTFRLLRGCGTARLLRLRKSFGKPVTVLTLHRISPEPNFFWQPISPQRFEQLLAYCTRHYAVTTFRDLGKRPAGRPALILSFDDGYHDFVEYAMPLLRKYGATCNHNLIVDCIEQKGIPWTQVLNLHLQALRDRGFHGTLDFGGSAHQVDGTDAQWTHTGLGIYLAALKLTAEQRAGALQALQSTHGLPPATARMMDWNDARQAATEGVEIGSHTMSHDSLPTISDTARLRHELAGSKRRLESELSLPVEILSVPNGQYDGRVVGLATEVGYRLVLLADDGMHRSETHTANGGITLVPRINMVEEDVDELVLRAEGFHDLVRRLM